VVFAFLKSLGVQSVVHVRALDTNVYVAGCVIVLNLVLVCATERLQAAVLYLKHLLTQAILTFCSVAATHLEM
jgi:hypothetical protein